MYVDDMSNSIIAWAAYQVNGSFWPGIRNDQPVLDWKYATLDPVNDWILILNETVMLLFEWLQRWMNLVFPCLGYTGKWKHKSGLDVSLLSHQWHCEGTMHCICQALTVQEEEYIANPRTYYQFMHILTQVKPRQNVFMYDAACIRQ